MTKAATSFGVVTRGIRSNLGQRLKDMSDVLDVTPSYLSAVETGGRNVPADWVDKLAVYYGLSDEQQTEMRRAAHESRVLTMLDVRHLPASDRLLVSDVIDRLVCGDVFVRDGLAAVLRSAELTE